MRNIFLISKEEVAPIHGGNATFVDLDAINSFCEEKKLVGLYSPDRNDITYYFPERPLVCIKSSRSGNYYIFIACESSCSESERKKDWFNITTLGQTDRNGNPLYPEWYNLNDARTRISMLTRLREIKTTGKEVLRDVDCLSYLGVFHTGLFACLADSESREIRFGKAPSLDFAHPAPSAHECSFSTHTGNEFEIGDVVVFPPRELMGIRIDGHEIVNGDIALIMSVLAWNKRYGYFSMPISIFRRIPSFKKVNNNSITEERLLFEDNKVGWSLAYTETDLECMKRLDGRTLVVKDKLLLHSGKVSDGDKTMIFYKWNEIVFID